MNSTLTPLEKECFEGLTVHLSREAPALLDLRDYLLSFKNAGLDKPSMERLLSALLRDLPNREDTIFDLLDLVLGFCKPDLAIFHVDTPA